MDVVVRKSSDGDAAYSIAKSLPGYFNAGGLKEIEKAVENEILFVAYVNSEAVGFLTVREANKDVVELTWMGVLPEYQSKGVGTQLLHKTLEVLKGNYKMVYGKTLADTVEDEGYSQTRNFWFKNGFMPIETIDPYPGWDPGNPCLIFAKPL